MGEQEQLQRMYSEGERLAAWARMVVDSREKQTPSRDAKVETRWPGSTQA